MPLPFIPVAIALGATALFGAKKGYDGYTKIDAAKKQNEYIQKQKKSIDSELDSTKESTNLALTALGECKIDIVKDGSIARFIEIASRIKHMEDEDFQDDNNFADPMIEELHNLKNFRLSILEIAGGAVGAIGTGAAAAFGAVGGVTLWGAASTGTAITTLAGAAASNATLAWLGGGSLAAGGFGMAGGAAMLGGIAAAPLLLVGGLFLNSK